MIMMRISPTMIATNTGTVLKRVSAGSKPPASVWWLRIATETPHHVRVAFIMAARSQAANKYHTSPGCSFPFSGVNKE